MYKILIMGRAEASRYSYKDNEREDYVVISINEPGGGPNHFYRQNKYLKAVLPLYFDDITEDFEGGTTMSKDDALKIMMFTEHWMRYVNAIIVHCHAGISRSSAVACIISRYLNESDEEIWESNKYLPNKLCYQLTAEAFDIKYDEKEFDEKFNKAVSVASVLNHSNYISLSDLV